MIAALYDAPLPPLRGSEFTSTQFDFVPVAMILVALALYLWGVRRNNLLHPRHPWSVGKAVAFLGALFTTGVAIFSFVGVYDGELFWDHMVQHLLLIMVAAPLFAISSPLDLAWRATTGTGHMVVAEALRSRVAKFLGHPIVAFVLYAVLIPITHLTVWYNYTLTHETCTTPNTWRSSSSGTCSGARSSARTPTATACIRPCSSSICSWPSRSTPSPGCPWPAPPTSCSPPTSPRTGPGGPPTSSTSTSAATSCGSSATRLMLWPMIPVALRWLHMDERKAVRIDRELDASGTFQLVGDGERAL